MDRIDYKVNRKQFHFLLVRFLAEHRLTKKWYEDSIHFKQWDTCNSEIYKKYNIKDDDDFDTHLYKCIDIYLGDIRSYDGYIYGFFRYIPSGGCDFGYNWKDFWCKYSDMWEEKYEFVKYEKY